MAFDRPPENKSLSEIIEELDRWKISKTTQMKFILNKDHGLKAEADFSFEAAPGKKVGTIRISDRGVISQFRVSQDGICLIAENSLNDDTPGVSVQEETIRETHKQILIDYFTDHPNDVPDRD